MLYVGGGDRGSLPYQSWTIGQTEELPNMDVTEIFDDEDDLELVLGDCDECGEYRPVYGGNGADGYEFYCSSCLSDFFEDVGADRDGVHDFLRDTFGEEW